MIRLKTSERSTIPASQTIRIKCLNGTSIFKVSSNPKIGGINKWRFFINASNKHPQFSLILLNIVSFYNLCIIFAYKCLKMKLLIEICTVLLRFFLNVQLSIYFLADLNIGHCVELTFLQANSEDCYWFITRFLYLNHEKIHPTCPQKRSTQHNDLCLDLLKSICLPVLFFFYQILYNRGPISIPNFILKH